MLKGTFAYFECRGCEGVYGEAGKPCDACGEMREVTPVNEFTAMVSIPYVVQGHGEEMEENIFLHYLRNFIVLRMDALVDAKVHKAPRLVEAVLDRLDEYVAESEHQGEIVPEALTGEDEVQSVGMDFGIYLQQKETWEPPSPPSPPTMYIVCTCGSPLILIVRGGQYQRLYQGKCACSRSWNLEDISCREA